MSQVQTIKARVNQMIEREIERCKTQMGEAEWEKHKDWVTENVVAGAKAWIARRAAEGRL